MSSSRLSRITAALAALTLTVGGPSVADAKKKHHTPCGKTKTHHTSCKHKAKKHKAKHKAKHKGKKKPHLPQGY